MCKKRRTIMYNENCVVESFDPFHGICVYTYPTHYKEEKSLKSPITKFNPSHQFFKDFSEGTD